MVTKRDYYEVLGLERTASVEEIRRAYRKLARVHHPDVNPGDSDAEEKFKEINEAQEILTDPEHRARYDRFGHEAPGGGGIDGGAGFGDLFSMFFNQTGQQGGGRPESGRDGNDLKFDLTITLEEAHAGIERTVQVARQESCDNCRGTGARPGTQPQRCPTCNGSGQVRHVQNTILGSFATVAPCARCRGEGYTITTPCDKCNGAGRVRVARDKPFRIPAGVEDGMHLQISGEGDAGLRGGHSGDLYIQIHVREHAVFKRKGSELYAQIPFSFAQLALGANVKAPTLSGFESLDIPAGTQPGTTFRLRGKGMPDVNARRGPGDLHIIASVRVPTKLTEDQKQILRQFSALGAEEDRSGIEQEKGLFGKVIDAFK